MWTSKSYLHDECPCGNWQLSVQNLTIAPLENHERHRSGVDNGSARSVVPHCGAVVRAGNVGRRDRAGITGGDTGQYIDRARNKSCALQAQQGTRGKAMNPIHGAQTTSSSTAYNLHWPRPLRLQLSWARFNGSSPPSAQPQAPFGAMAKARGYGLLRKTL